MRFVFTLAISGSGADESRAFEDALEELTKRLEEGNEAPTVLEQFSDLVIESRECDDAESWAIEEAPECRCVYPDVCFCAIPGPDAPRGDK